MVKGECYAGQSNILKTVDFGFSVLLISSLLELVSSSEFSAVNKNYKKHDKYKVNRTWYEDFLSVLSESHT